MTFKWKDYRIKGRDRLKTMTLNAAEFIRRFLLHLLPSGFHRIRHYGLFAGTVRARNVERARLLLAAPERSPAETDPDFEDRDTEGPSPGHRCPCCGGRMIIVGAPRARHRRPGSGSTPHDNRRASRHAAPFLLASSRAPEQERDVLTTSANSLQPLRSRQALASSRSKKLAVFAPTDNTGRLRPPPPHKALRPRPQNPHRLRPAKPRLFLPAVSSLRGFRTPAPRPAPRACKGPPSETLQ